MAQACDPNERYDGVDRSVLDDDVWSEASAKRVCPTCRLSLDPGAIRCPRCNALVLLGCGGSCASCGANACVRRDEQD